MPKSFSAGLPFRFLRLCNRCMGKRSETQAVGEKGVPAVDKREPLYAPDQEAQSLKELDEILAKKEGVAKLVAPNGEERELPHSVYEVLRNIVHDMAQGVAVTIMPVHSQLTTQQAAEVLGVSRPHLITLLEKEEIPFHKIGTHRRIRLDDLLVYKYRRDSKRREILNKIKADSEELGLYDLEDE